MTRRISACFVLALFAAGAAHAQTPQATPTPAAPGRGLVFIGIDGAGQVTSTSADSSVTYKVYGEDATLQATYKTKAVPAFGARAGIRVWRRLTVGGAVSRFTDSAAAAVTARVPHPFFFDRPRQIDGTAEDILREETVAYAEIGWTFALSRKMDLTLFAGPAFFTVRQEVAGRVLYAESYPYDSAAFTGVESTVKKASATGTTAGVDVTYLFSRSFGVGVLLRYSQATAEVTPADGRPVTLDLGGLQVGGGLRFRF